jgi:hypothetical protein
MTLAIRWPHEAGDFVSCWPHEPAHRQQWRTLQPAPGSLMAFVTTPRTTSSVISTGAARLSSLAHPVARGRRAPSSLSLVQTLRRTAQQAVEAVGRASWPAAASFLSPVVMYHGLGHRLLHRRGFLMRPQLNSATLGRRKNPRMRNRVRDRSVRQATGRLVPMTAQVDVDRNARSGMQAGSFPHAVFAARSAF